MWELLFLEGREGGVSDGNVVVFIVHVMSQNGSRNSNNIFLKI